MKYLSVIMVTIIAVLTDRQLNAQDRSTYLARKVTLKEVPLDTDFSSLQQDKDGFMWLGGLSGLYRYDGARVTRKTAIH